MSSGIASQYGFLYQRYVFIRTVLEEAGMDRHFVYEGVDDIDVSESDGIMGISQSGGTLIQVKSGTVSKSCWVKVLCNWLLTGGEESYRAVLENEPLFDIRDPEIVQDVVNYAVAGKDKRTTSIANRVYKKHLVGVERPEEVFGKQVENLLQRVTYDVLPLDELKETAKEIFERVYCQDIVVYTMAKTCRYERFVELVKSEIDASLGRKRRYVLRYTDFMRLVNLVTSEVSDQRYVIDVSATKKRKRGQAKILLGEGDLREVRQLRLVNDDDGFIVHELVKELLYRDLRDVYSDVRTTLIANMEDTARSNYDDVMYELSPNPDPGKVFRETTSRNIPSQIVDDSPVYRNGCYVYLTGDSIGEDMRIAWGREDE